jgi:hypothetical protein
MVFKILIVVRDSYNRFAVNVLPDIGDAQAAFIKGPFLTCFI